MTEGKLPEVNNEYPKWNAGIMMSAPIRLGAWACIFLTVFRQVSRQASRRILKRWVRAQPLFLPYRHKGSILVWPLS
jgi:hypothetical protein